MKAHSTHASSLMLLVMLAAGLALASASSASQKGDDSQKVAKTNQRQDSASKHEPLASVARSQPIAEKKQGDSSLSADEEYVQIKPEELTGNESGRELLESIMSEQSTPTGGQQSAEHKSAADDDLSAQLAQDSIQSQESAYRPIAAPVAPASPRISAAGRPYGAPRPLPAGYAGPALPRHPLRGPAQPARMPPSYITLKGKLTGINSLINQYPHPAPGYPHQGPRHLPRGAAAGYAAFRDFVRAHASKYKGAGHPAGPPASGGYQAPPVAPEAGRYEPAKGSPGAAPAYGGEPAAKGANYPRSAPKSKVTVAQAYIPHLAAGAGSGHGAQQAQPGPYASNPVLAKLYGGHAPQGVGKPEYSKDYGVVLHYPQATVYTEPMTVDQLHKLAGNGISQILEHLQYNLASGQRDESNTIRSNSKHHIGHGVTIHAKEYYAPGKGGHYVPTTAAVISGPGKAGAYEQQETANGYDAAAGSAQINSYQPTISYGANKELGSGYERVKQAVAAGQSERYNNRHTNNAARPMAADYQHQSASGYGESEGKNGEPLSALTNFLGHELESLYKANAALTKQLEPEIHAQIQAYTKSGAYGAQGPLRYHNFNQHAPLALQQQHSAGLYGAPQQPSEPMGKYNGRAPAGYGNQRPARGPRKGPHSSRYNSRGPQPAQHPLNGYRQQAPRHYGQPQNYGNRPHQAGNYMQQQAYQAAEQAFNQQVVQMLQDFQSSDEQYNGKGQPMHSTNQGYPNKVMHKHQQHQSPQQQGHYAAQLEGLEIPQGPNDQIGEISELIEALKGSLESQGQQPGEQQAPQYAADGGYRAAAPAASSQPADKVEEVKYLTSALGQAPSFSAQVPVLNGDQHQLEAGKNGYQSQSYQQPQPDQSYQQQSQPQPQPQQPASYQSPVAPAADSYEHQHQHQPQQQPQAQQPATYAAQPASYGQQSLADQYQQAAGQLAPQDQYQQAQQDHLSQPASGGYGTPLRGPASSVVAGTYPAPQQSAGPLAQVAAPALQSPEPVGSGYATNSEHTSVINHLVPVASQQPATHSSAGAYDSAPAPAAHQPANQIAVAAPSDSQYQQAQSLSSFVDSLPSDYQELLRQPAILDANSNLSHLAALGQEASSGYSNATSSSYDSPEAAASQPIAAAYASQAAGASSPSSASHSPSSAASASSSSSAQASSLSQSQKYSPSSQSQATKGQHSSANSSSQQYASIKK